MTGVATAIGLGVAAVGTVAASAISAGGAESAAQTQANAAENAQNISQQEFNTITQQEQPFMQAGYGAQNQLNYLLGIGSPGTNALAPNAQGGYGATGSLSSLGMPYDPSSGYALTGAGGIQQLLANGPSTGGARPTATGAPAPGVAPAVAGGSPAGGFGSLLAPFTADTFKQYSPAYQFQLQQGKQGVLNADSAGQGALSGAALKDLLSFNQNYANTAFNNAFNQYQTQQGNIYSRLAGIAQLGQAAAANTGQQGTALAGQAAQSATNVGTALAGGTVGAANALSGGINSLSALPWLYGGGGGGVTGASLGMNAGGAYSGTADAITEGIGAL